MHELFSPRTVIKRNISGKLLELTEIYLFIMFIMVTHKVVSAGI